MQTLQARFGERVEAGLMVYSPQLSIHHIQCWGPLTSGGVVPKTSEVVMLNTVIFR